MSRRWKWILVIFVAIFFLSIPFVHLLRQPEEGILPFLVMVDDVIYQRGGAAPKTPQEPFDGTITSCTDFSEIPTENLQANYEPIHNQPYVFADDTLLIREENGVWYIWKPSETQP